MRLKKILSGINYKEIKNFKDYQISSITHICDDVQKGSIFICINGNKFNGNDFALMALDKGAKCIITEDKSIELLNCTVVVVDNCRIAMSQVAKNFYNRCADSLDIVAVVGTAGKTSTSTIIGNLLSNIDNNIGIIGTNGVFIKGVKQENKFTTPDPIDLHYIFFQMKMLGVKTVIMEVSAQAIYYKKIYGIKFKYGIFTNISKEHLDFFGSYEKYVKTKMDFFTSDYIESAIINTDDFYGRELALKCKVPAISYGIFEPANSFALDIKYSLDKTEFVANILDNVLKVKTSFVGEYNVYNLLASITCALLLGASIDTLKKAVNLLKPIDGRFNVYKIGYKKIIIDFAHTPESIEKLLSHIRNYSTGKIITVFGCVGYSDKEKRKEMGEVVSRYSDSIIITTDNIGDADFREVALDIFKGIGNNLYTCI